MTPGAPLVVIRRDTVKGDALTRVLDSLLSFCAGATVVEVGCGIGGLAAWFATKVDGGRVIGVDCSTAMLARAVRQASDAALSNLVFVKCDVYRLPFQEGTADVVISKSLLCVLREVDRAIAEMQRALKPGGLLISIEPCSGHLFHDPEDSRYAELSHKLNDAFCVGWQRRGVDQRVGLRVPSAFLRQGLEQITVDVISRVHLVADVQRSRDDVFEQLETESYRLPESTVAIVTDGGMSRRELQEHNQRARDRLERFRSDTSSAARRGYIRLNPAMLVTVGRTRHA